MKKLFLLTAMAVCAMMSFAQADSTKTRKQITWPEEKPDTLIIKAQKEPAQWHHNVQFGAGIGVHALLHQIFDGQTNPYVGGTIDAQYQYMITPRWGVGVGFGFSSLGSVDHMPIEENLENRELQSAHMFNVPVEAVYYHPLNRKWALEGRAGLALNVLMSSRYKFTLHTHEKRDGHNDLHRVNLSGIGEFGALWEATERTAVYAGLYADYGMVNMAKHKYKRATIDDADFILSVMHQPTLAGDVHPFEFGVKVGVRLGLKDRMPVYVDKKCPVCPEPEPCPECPKCPEPEPCPEPRPCICPEPEPCPACPEVEAREEQQRLLEQILSAATYETAKFAPIFDENADAMFQSLQESMDQYPDNMIIVTGHTDNVGSDEYNMHLGLQRANAFRDALVEHGIDPERIICETKGKTRPIASNDTEEGRAKNRRVALTMR